MTLGKSTIFQLLGDRWYHFGSTWDRLFWETRMALSSFTCILFLCSYCYKHAIDDRTEVCMSIDWLLWLRLKFVLVFPLVQLGGNYHDFPIIRGCSWVINLSTIRANTVIQKVNYMIWESFYCWTTGRCYFVFIGLLNVYMVEIHLSYQF